MDSAFAGHFVRARASLGVESFGLSLLSFGPDFAGYPEHSHAVEGQEEVLVILAGTATLHVDGEVIDLDRETMVRLNPSCRRKVIAGPAGVRFLVVGGRPGSAYAAPEFSEHGAPDTARRSGPSGLIATEAKPHPRDQRNARSHRRHDRREHSPRPARPPLLNSFTQMPPSVADASRRCSRNP